MDFGGVGPAMTLKQAAIYLNASEWTVRALYLKGMISFQKLGKRYIFSRTDLDEYIERSWRKNGN